MIAIDIIEKKYKVLRKSLNEAALRVCAAADAKLLGRGGITLVAKASGLSRTTIYAGFRDLEGEAQDIPQLPVSKKRIRKEGGGRKKVTELDPTLERDLEYLVDPVTRGDPENPLRWTCKSTSKLASELQKQGHKISSRTVWMLLDQMGYSMQSNRKTLEGSKHPDRDKQFQYIAEKVKDFQSKGIPVISVDTKKKELIGRFKNQGREWQKKNEPEKVNVHDFADKELGKVIPYGVYDMTRNEGWVSVGITHDTAEFAVATIRQWWIEMGHPCYPESHELLITADGGGSNGSRVRLWKVALHRFAKEFNLTITICHFPPGTSKWNKIEHRMFAYITANWRGRPLESRATVVNLIAATSTQNGLKIKASIDDSTYSTGIRITNDELDAVSIESDQFHGEWNYKIKP